MVGEDGRPRVEAVAPDRLAAVGVRPMTYYVVVAAGADTLEGRGSTWGQAVEDGGSSAGDYRLSIDVEPAAAGDEWEPDDDPEQASPLAPFRQGGAAADSKEHVLGRTAGRGRWSGTADRDCFELPTGFRNAAELEVSVRPPPGVAARLWVVDAADPETHRRGLLGATTAEKPGGTARLSVGVWQWKSALVACAGPAGGRDFTSSYRIEVRAIEPEPERPVELEPNDERRRAQHVPPTAHIRGHLPPGDIDQFILEPVPKGELTATLLAPAPASARLLLLDPNGAELARAAARSGSAAKVTAKGAAYAVVQSGAAAAGEQTGQASETAYQLELAAALPSP